MPARPRACGLAREGTGMDLRIQKTYKALIVAFTKLLEEMPYENITIAMLCDEAMIRRTTFYKHFADKDAFFSFFVDSLRIDMQQRGEQVADEERGHQDFDAEREAIFSILIEFLMRHEKLMDNIFKSSMAGRMSTVFADKVAETICERHRGGARTVAGGIPLESAAQFAAGGIIRLVEIWWQRGHKPEEEGSFIHASNVLVSRALEQ